MPRNQIITPVKDNDRAKNQLDRPVILSLYKSEPVANY